MRKKLINKLTTHKISLKLNSKVIKLKNTNKSNIEATTRKIQTNSANLFIIKSLILLI